MTTPIINRDGAATKDRWNIMIDMFFYRDLVEVEKEDDMTTMIIRSSEGYFMMHRYVF
jgi:hypothetical protein